MPCNSDHMNPQPREVTASQCLTLLDELKGKEFDKDNYEGYHPKAYCKGITKADCDLLTKRLCHKLQNISDVTKYSLELQIWWRDHQLADKERLAKEIDILNKEEMRKNALSKLTHEERLALGLNDKGFPF